MYDEGLPQDRLVADQGSAPEHRLFTDQFAPFTGSNG